MDSVLDSERRSIGLYSMRALHGWTRFSIQWLRFSVESARPSLVFVSFLASFFAGCSSSFSIVVVGFCAFFRTLTRLENASKILIHVG
eukprot:GSA25T00014952001.1